MVRKTKARGAVLQPIPDNEEVGPAGGEGAGAVLDVVRLINDIEVQMEERTAAIKSAAEDAIVSLRNDLKTRIVRLPKSTREMPLKEFQEKYPEDFKTGALQEIRQRYAAMAQAAQAAVPGGGTKRAAEPATVLRTVKARRTAPAVAGSWGAEAATAAPAPRRGDRGDAEPAAPRQSADTQQPAGPRHGAFNGLPLQTPLPFAGAAMPLPVTMLTQKRGGRTRAVAAPEAAVVTTADGMQWALSKEGVAAIPESHRAEVAEMLSAQFTFLAAALGKTVFEGRGGRAGKR